MYLTSYKHVHILPCVINAPSIIWWIITTEPDRYTDESSHISISVYKGFNNTAVVVLLNDLYTDIMIVKLCFMG